MERILIDMDGVIADVVSEVIDWYERLHGVRVPVESLRGKREVDAFPIPGALFEIVHTKGFFLGLPVMTDSQRVVKDLAERYEVYICSAATEFPNSLTEKVHWLAEHFPFIGWQHIILCGNKHIIEADWMIDDHLKNLKHFGGKKILFTQPHNALVEGYERADSWGDVERILLG